MTCETCEPQVTRALQRRAFLQEGAANVAPEITVDKPQQFAARPGDGVEGRSLAADDPPPPCLDGSLPGPARRQPLGSHLQGGPSMVAGWTYGSERHAPPRNSGGGRVEGATRVLGVIWGRRCGCRSISTSSGVDPPPAPQTRGVRCIGIAPGTTSAPRGNACHGILAMNAEGCRFTVMITSNETVHREGQVRPGRYSEGDVAD